MFEYFTVRARRVLALANDEAMRHRDACIGPEHILLAMLVEGAGVAGSVLRNFGLTVTKLRPAIQALSDAAPGEGATSSGRASQSPEAKRLIEIAIEHARSLGHNYVGTEHLLLGLLDACAAEDELISIVLKKFGISPDVMREEVSTLLSTCVPEPRASRARSIGALDSPDSLLSLLLRCLAQFELLRDRSDEIRRQKDAAVAAADYETTSALRDCNEKLRRQFESLERFVPQLRSLAEELERARRDSGE